MFFGVCIEAVRSAGSWNRFDDVVWCRQFYSIVLECHAFHPETRWFPASAIPHIDLSEITWRDKACTALTFAHLCGASVLYWTMVNFHCCEGTVTAAMIGDTLAHTVSPWFNVDAEDMIETLKLFLQGSPAGVLDHCIIPLEKKGMNDRTGMHIDNAILFIALHESDDLFKVVANYDASFFYHMKWMPAIQLFQNPNYLGRWLLQRERLNYHRMNGVNYRLKVLDEIKAAINIVIPAQRNRLGKQQRVHNLYTDLFLCVYDFLF
jgi:hypothetical protein